MWTIRKGGDIGEVDKSKVVENVCNISYMTAIKEEQNTRRSGRTINQSTTMTQF